MIAALLRPAAPASHEPGPSAPACDAALDGLFDTPFAALDDDALLAHFKSRRGVHVDVVVDPEEASAARLDGVMAGRFEFNDEAHELPDPVDWLVNPSADVEWHILLHKAYWAPGLAQRFRERGDVRVLQRWQTLLDGWMRQVPPGFIAADVTGRRVQNWIYALVGFLEAGAPVDPAFLRRLLHALHVQVEHLCAHLTPKRNHRTIELTAIFLAGVALPEMARAAHWRRFALGQIAVNVEADLLPDGVHCELSTDYHHLALRNWMLVRTLAARHGVAVPAALDRRLEAALGFALHVHRPDGIVPSFSDGDARGYLGLLAQGAAWYGRADFRWAATRGADGAPPARTLALFPDAGYAVVRSGWGRDAADFGCAQHLVFDCGPLGEGNHGHFDCLSFELHAHGRPLVVDPGRGTYSEAGRVNWRVHFRSTAAHNTVCVDGRSQTRYEPRPVKDGSRHAGGSVRHKVTGPAPDATLLAAAEAHDFALLHGRAASHEYDARHERRIVRLGAIWLVLDALRAPTPHHYALRFQLDAAANERVRLADAGAQWRLDAPGLVLVQPGAAERGCALVAAWVAPRYGVRVPAPALVTRAHGTDVDFDSVLLPFAEVAPRAAARRIALAGWRGIVVAHDAEGVDVIDTWLHADAGGADAALLPMQGGTLHVNARWLWLRQATDGRVLRAVTHAGGRASLDTRSLELEHAGPAQAEGRA